MNIRLVVILGAVIVVLGTLLTLQAKRMKRIAMERDQVISYNNAKSDSIEYLTTELGKESARSEVLELTNRNLRQLQDDKELAWIKEIRAVNKRMNNVEQIMSTTAHAMWDFKLDLLDTLISQPSPDIGAPPIKVPARKFDNRDKWIRLTGYVLPDTIVITPNVHVPINSVVYWQRRKGILGLKIGRREWYKETTSPNPYVRITENKLIKISKGRKHKSN